MCKFYCLLVPSDEETDIDAVNDKQETELVVKQETPKGKDVNSPDPKLDASEIKSSVKENSNGSANKNDFEPIDSSEREAEMISLDGGISENGAILPEESCESLVTVEGSSENIGEDDNKGIQEFGKKQSVTNPTHHEN